MRRLRFCQARLDFCFNLRQRSRCSLLSPAGQWINIPAFGSGWNIVVSSPSPCHGMAGLVAGSSRSLGSLGARKASFLCQCRWIVGVAGAAASGGSDGSLRTLISQGLLYRRWVGIVFSSRPRLFKILEWALVKVLGSMEKQANAPLRSVCS